MKRDMDLVRKILIKVAELSTYDEPVEIDVEDYTRENIQYHLKLLHQANLIEIRDDGLSELWGKMDLTPTCLTWDGNDFLTVAQNDTLWQKAKKLVSDKGGSLTFEVIKGVLAQLARQTVGLP
jgi:hypothetical protein